MISARFEALTSRSRGGVGRLRIAIERATDTERTAEIFREAAMIPHCSIFPLSFAGLLSGRPSGNVSPSPAIAAGAGLGAWAKYSGLPTKKANCGDGVAARTSSQNVYR